MSAENLYRDTRERYYTDAEFHAAVEQLARMAEQFGFTPGELKQIAFAAAMRVEERTPGMRFRIRDLDEQEIIDRVGSLAELDKKEADGG